MESIRLIFEPIARAGYFDSNKTGICGGPKWIPGDLTPIETFICQQCGEKHPVLYTVTRKPCGKFNGCDIVRYCGDEHVLLSPHIKVDQLPRDAVRLSPDEAAAYYHPGGTK